MAKSSALSLHRRSGSRSCSLRDLRKRQTVIRHRADASHVRGYFSGFPFGVAGGAGLDLPDPRNMRAQPDIAGLAVERSEEHTSELQSLMRISYAVFCLKKKNKYIHSMRYRKHAGK